MHWGGYIERRLFVGKTKIRATVKAPRIPHFTPTALAASNLWQFAGC